MHFTEKIVHSIYIDFMSKNLKKFIILKLNRNEEDSNT